MRRFILLIIICCAFNSSWATHLLGAEITYRYLDTLKYEVTVTYYRDCSGIAYQGANLIVSCVGGTRADTLTPTAKGIEDITPVCASDTARCQPSNQKAGEGVEKHVFIDTVDINLPKYSYLKNCSGKIILATSINGRSSKINTGPSGIFYNYAELDLKNFPENSSPEITTDAVPFLCCNQPVFYNIGAMDTLDGDSLSYAWAPPITGNLQPPSYSFQQPFTAFYPGRRHPPYKNINANPPHGIHLDTETGDMIFTPVSCTEVTVAVIEVTEWRKDSNGISQKIGVTRRDLQYNIRTCPDNNPPEIKGPYRYDVCEGSTLCFDVETDDEQFIPAPPAQPRAADTVTLSWNEGISESLGASFTVLTDTVRLQTGRFCWTPKEGMARNLPYQFIVSARDQACPINAVSSRAFQITVKPRAKAESLMDTLDCGKYALESNRTNGFLGNPSYSWTLLDSNANLVFDNKQGYFTSSGNFISRKRLDSLQFRAGGMYIIQHDVNNLPINCPSTYYDTLVVPKLLEVDLAIGEDTFVCAGVDLTLRPLLKNATPPTTYQWSTMGVTDGGDFLSNTTANPGDTLNRFVFSIPLLRYDTAVAVLIQDQTGCTAEDTVQVFLRANPKAQLPLDDRICAYDSLTLIPQVSLAEWVDRESGDTLLQGDTLTKEWLYLSDFETFSIEDSVTIQKEGYYVLRVSDSLNCQNTDTFYLAVNDTVTALAGPDQTVCAEDSYSLSAGGLDSLASDKTGFYKWYNITGNTDNWSGEGRTHYRIADQDSTYRVELFVTEGGVECQDDDSLTISVNQLPLISLGSDEEVCCDHGRLSLNLKIIKPSGLPTTGGWSCTEFPDLINNSQFVIDSACKYITQNESSRNFYTVYSYQEPMTGCISKDSLSIKVLQLPDIVLRDKIICRETETELKLKDLVVLPAISNSGTINWECEQCNGNDFNEMLENRGSDFVSDYWLNFDTTYYRYKNEDKDTFVLIFSYTNQNFCKNSAKVNVFMASSPQIKSLNDTTVCEGMVKFFLDSNYNYIWNTGDLGREVNAVRSGTYSFVATNEENCTATDSLEIQVNKIDVVMLEDSILNCGPYQFSLKPSGSYRWSNGDSTNEAMITQSDEIWVNYLDSNGCESRDTGYVEVIFTTTPVISKMGDSIYSDQEGFHYWFKNMLLLENQNGNSIEPNGVGLYTAVFVDEYGCESDTSNQIAETVGIQELEQIGLRIYPNPSKGEFQLYTVNRNQIDVTQMYVFNHLGQRIALEWQKNSLGYLVKLNESQGLYHLVVVTKNGSYFSKIMIR